MLSALIIGLGILCFAVLFGIVLTGASDESFRTRFARSNDLTYRRDDTEQILRGTFRDRELEIREAPEGAAARLRIRAELGGTVGPGAHVRVTNAPVVAEDEPEGTGLEASAIEAAGEGAAPDLVTSDRAAVESWLNESAAGGRALELLAAEPRLRIDGDAVAYVAAEPLRGRAELEELADRMVESARHVDDGAAG